MISVIIPNHNGEETIGSCLERIFASHAPPFEVIVVDDCSSDGSVEVITRYPCRLIRLERRSGAGRARNVGAAHSRGDILFFTDADCLARKDTLSRAAEAVAAGGPEAVIGGTYAALPADEGFYGLFQSLFIRYNETKDRLQPDYIATHAMAMHRRTFERSGGFREDFLPIVEDVEFSHRVRESGCFLTMGAGVEVAHFFAFDLGKSLKNAFRKSFWWTCYSLSNGDLLADSGTASRGLKLSVFTQAICVFALAAAFRLSSPWPLMGAGPALAISVAANAGLFREYFIHGGGIFGFSAVAYYLGPFAFAVGAGAITGAARTFLSGFGKQSVRKWHFPPSVMSDR